MELYVINEFQMKQNVHNAYYILFLREINMPHAYCAQYFNMH